jgi:hypothetical protein
MKIRPVGDELFHAHRHDESNSHFSQGKAPKKENCPCTHHEGIRGNVGIPPIILNLSTTSRRDSQAMNLHHTLLGNDGERKKHVGWSLSFD